jgi:hypothetical protein
VLFQTDNVEMTDSGFVDEPPSEVLVGEPQPNSSLDLEIQDSRVWNNFTRDYCTVL